MKSISSVNTAQLLEWGPKMASGLLVVAIAYALTQWVWLFSGSATNAINAPAANFQPQTKRNQTRAERTAGEIALRHLFGKAAPVEVSEIIKDAQPTVLNLTLVGILAISEKEGLAIIKSGGQKEDVYSIGETVPGNAKLKAVYVDRVILESSRGLESLALPKKSDLIKFTEVKLPSAPEPGPGRQSKFSQDSLANYRKKMMSDPASMAGMAKFFAPEKLNGELVGYKLTPNHKNLMLAEVGLKGNDVITSINGVRLNRPENSMRALQRLRRDKKVTIVVIRDGNETIINHEMK